jgi:hypothetical protein
MVLIIRLLDHKIRTELNNLNRLNLGVSGARRRFPKNHRRWFKVASFARLP